MAEYSDELKKLAAIAADLDLPAELRSKAVKQLGNINTHEALLVLLGIASSESLNPRERDFALKQSRKIVKSSHR